MRDLRRGNLWTAVRAAAQPVFHAKSLSQYAEVMNEAASMMNDDIASAAEKDHAFNICETNGKMTMRVVMKCAFGYASPPVLLFQLQYQLDHPKNC